MSGDDTPGAAPEPVAHPLALDLTERLAAGVRGRVLLLGVGSGRNIPPLLAADLPVDAVEDDPERALSVRRRYADDPRLRVTHRDFAGPYPEARGYAAALSTHALLHGTQGSTVATVAAIRACLRDGAPLYATFGSTSDPRFGHGRRIEANTFSASAGSEAGVPHTYFDERRLRELLAGFDIESVAERSAAESAGRWAHRASEAAAMVHWLVRARRR